MIHEKRYIDKEEWAEGPWKLEADMCWWIHENGLPCYIERSNTKGTLNGWVGLNFKHSYFMKEYECNIFPKSPNVYMFLKKTDELFLPCQRLWWVGFTTVPEKELMPKQSIGVDYLKFLREQKAGIKKYKSQRLLMKDINSLAKHIQEHHMSHSTVK